MLIDEPQSTATLEPVEIADIHTRELSILGVRMIDTTQPAALTIMERLLTADDGRCHSIFFVNAHTLNVATDDRAFRDVLNRADYVFNDGTGVRWAARQRGIEVQDNLNGTDLVPAFFAATAGCGYRYFLLGATPQTIEIAADTARQRFSGWEQAGYHHGYVLGPGGERVIDDINAARPDMLLVGMGNPLQEKWITRYQDQLQVPLAIGVGGLFDHWGGNLTRAPRWVRRAGCEWVCTLLMQPYKWRRYLLGNPKFLYRITRELHDDLARMRSGGTAM